MMKWSLDLTGIELYMDKNLNDIKYETTRFIRF